MRSSSRHGLSRRQLLQGLGLGATVGPLIPLLNASGQEAGMPKRLLLLFTPDGAPAGVNFQPQGTASAFTFHMIHQPLDPMKAKIVIPWGLNLSAGGAGEAHAHGMAGLWTATTLAGPSAGADFDGGNGNRTGWGQAPSIDQIVAKAAGPNSPYKRLATDPMPETPYRSLAFGVQCGNPNSLNRMTYTAANQPIHPEMNPKTAFDRLFANVKPSTGMPSTGAPVADPAAVQTLAEQKAVVDVLKGDLARLRKRVGAEEFLKIDSHLEGLLSLERRLTPVVPVAGGPSAACSLPAAVAANANFPTQITQMMDITAAAFACDLTRVASLQISYAFSHVLHTWLSHSSDHHNMSHDGQNRTTELSAIDNWYAKQVLYLLQKLDSVKEGNGTLLDNTLVVWGRELGSTSHSLNRWPAILAGGANMGLKGGRYLNVDKEPHAKLLVSVANLMGVETMNVGNRAMNSGPLAGLV